MKYIRYRKVDDVEAPAYQSAGAVGFDIGTAVKTSVPSQSMVRIPTGLVIEVPHNHGLLVVPRSSTFSKYGLIMPHSIGVIDEDYCGHDDELLLQVYNLKPQAITIPAGTRIAQGLVIPIERVTFVEQAAALADSRGGFGSTDDKST